MSGTIITDTDILIDVARGVREAVDFLDQIKSQQIVAISPVTEIELITGCRNKNELKNLDLFLGDFERIKLNEDISDKAVNLIRAFRLSHGLLIADALIAATAITHKMEFATKNYKHFRFIPELNLRKY